MSEQSGASSQSTTIRMRPGICCTRWSAQSRKGSCSGIRTALVAGLEKISQTGALSPSAVLESAIVFVVEGEKDAEQLREHGFTATTNAGGAKAPWLPEFTVALAGREVILVPDRDVAGYARVKTIGRALLGKVTRLLYLELEDGKDVSEWFERGHSELELIRLLDPEEIFQ
jgi:5S rRNA maturation endonuclease (ribonuclease M5)